LEYFAAEFWKVMEFFGVTTRSPGDPFRVCFEAVHVRLWADARPDLTGGLLSLTRGLAPTMAIAVAIMFCARFSVPAPTAAGPGQATAARDLRRPSVAGDVLESGRASWYGSPGDGFAYRTTANGETMDPDAWTCAHRSLPFGTIVMVENLLNGRAAMLRVNDRGPYAGGRVVDLSRRGAAEIGLLGPGVAPVRIRLVEGILKGHVARPPRGARPRTGSAMVHTLGQAPRARLAEAQPEGGPAGLRRARPAPSAPTGGADRRAEGGRLDPFINRES
jgi:rare lipoprotein A